MVFDTTREGESEGATVVRSERLKAILAGGRGSDRRRGLWASQSRERLVRADPRERVRKSWTRS